MERNQRVKVQIQDKERYVSGCADSLDGKKGTITQFKGEYKDQRYLVKFDTPAKTWWENQSPVHEFWIDSRDLIEWHYK